MKNDFFEMLYMSFRLMKGKKIQLIIFLLIILLFNIEVALMMPLIIYYCFDAIAASDSVKLFIVTLVGGFVFAFNVVVMYMINVYGDAWATKFGFWAVKNVFIEMKRLPVWSLIKKYNKDDLYQRIVDGTRSIISLYFILVNLFSNVIACIILILILLKVSPQIASLVIGFVFLELLFVKLQYAFNSKMSQSAQIQRSRSIEKLSSLIQHSEFHKKNQTFNFFYGKYIEVRSSYYYVLKQQVIGNALFDILLKIYENFKVIFVYGGIIDREVMHIHISNIVSAFSIFDSLLNKASQLGGNLAQCPNSIVSIRRLEEAIENEYYIKRNQMTNALKLKSISVEVEGTNILKEVSCEIPYGAKIAIVGENGSGKSTFLRVIAGLCVSSEKEVFFTNKKIGYIPAEESLFKGKSVKENILYAEEIKENEIIDLLASFDIANGHELINKKVEHISGGEAKRVNIIRGIVSDPDIVIADEPTSSLDEKNAEKVINILLNLNSTVIYVTHSPKLASMADEIFIIEKGKIVEKVKKEECKHNAKYMEWVCRRNEKEVKDCNY